MLDAGIKHIWTTDSEFQTDALIGILKNIRNMNSDCVTDMFNYLKALGAFYVPYDNYMIEHFGSDITDLKYKIYQRELCKYTFRFAIPIHLLDGSTVGFIGYTNENDFDADGILIKYLYPPKSVLEKNKYMFIEPQEYLTAINDGYICVVDGIFDKISLASQGINAVSLCGSSYTQFHKMYLSLIKKIIIIADNDDAGNSLAYTIRQNRRDAVRIYQSRTKDIDSFMHDKESILRVKELISDMQTEGFNIDHTMKRTDKRVQIER
jgi:5S rRNA maturation endonuclease (ribonuclease M5)